MFFLWQKPYCLNKSDNSFIYSDFKHKAECFSLSKKQPLQLACDLVVKSFEVSSDILRRLKL